MDRAACNSLRTNVGMTIKGELYFLALVWVKGAVQRQNVKNLQINTIYMAIFYTGLKNVSTIILAWLEWLSVECRKTKTKVITLANHKEHTQYSEPIKTRSNYR